MPFLENQLMASYTNSAGFHTKMTIPRPIVIPISDKTYSTKEITS
jgi:hypothetical protein